MKRSAIALFVFLTVPALIYAGPYISSSGGGGSSTVDNNTIDSRIDQDHASSAETITGTLTTKSVTPKALADALGAYTHDIITTGSITGGAVTGTTGTFSGAITGSTVTSSGAVTGTSFDVTRGNYAQCTQMYESLDHGDNYVYECAAHDATEIYKISRPAAKMTAINQSRRCSAITSDNCTEEWFTPMTSTGTGLVERIGAAFDGGGSAIAANKTAYTLVPFAATINQWTVICDQDSGATGIVIDVLRQHYVEDDITLVSMLASGTKPHTSDGATAGGTSHQADWDGNATTINAGDVLQFKVDTAPTSATWCSITLKVTR